MLFRLNKLKIRYLFLLGLISCLLTACSGPVGSLNYSGEVLKSGQLSPYVGLNLITLPGKNTLKNFDLPTASIPYQLTLNQSIRRPATFLSPAVGLRIGLPYNFEAGIRYNWLRSANLFLRHGIIQSESFTMSFGCHLNYYNWNMHFRPNPDGNIYAARVSEYMFPINFSFKSGETTVFYIAPVLGKVYYHNYLVVQSAYPLDLYVPKQISFPQAALAFGLEEKYFGNNRVNIELYSNIYPFLSAEIALVFQIYSRKHK